MPTSGSRPPVQPQRKLVLRRKATTEQSTATSPAAPKDAGSPSLPPPPTLLPRAHRPIEHPPELDARPNPGSTRDSGVDWRSSSGSKAAALLTARSGATPIPLPSRVSVAPVVASVPITTILRPIPQGPSRGILLACTVVAGALVVGAVLVGAKLQIHPSAPVTTGPVEVVHATATSPNSPSPAQVVDTHPDRVTSVEDLPRAPVPARPPGPAMPRMPRAPGASASATAKPGTEAPTEGAEVTAASASGSPAASAAPESPSAQPVPEVDLPSTPPPPADPLIRAVRQSIDDPGH
jgi:hypothetical protein